MKQLNSLEVAKLAGVSRSTVSRVINGYSNVPESTRERVMKIIRDNGYYPHLSGQLLAGKKTGTLGFFWISLGDIASDSLSSSYFVNVTEAAALHGHLILTCILKNLTDCENVCWAKKVFTQGRIDGGIFIGVNNNEPVIEELISSGHVVGIFDHFHEDRLEPNRISVNFEDDTGSKVIDYLYECGHRKIGIIDGNMNRYSSAKRHESFLKGMQRHSLEIRREWMQYADVTEPAGYEAAKRMLASCTEIPTAICANNDAAAFGVYKALTEAGLSIPDQVSVTGIDGHGRGELSTPQLTTFAFDYHDFFYSLVSRTIAAIEMKSGNPTTEFMASRLVERSSVKRLAQ